MLHDFNFISISVFKKMIYIINAVRLNYKLITYSCIYTYNEIAVYRVNGKANLPIDL